MDVRAHFVMPSTRPGPHNPDLTGFAKRARCTALSRVQRLAARCEPRNDNWIVQNRHVHRMRVPSEGLLLAASRTAAPTNHTSRISFAKIAEPLEVPELLSLQTDSFDWLIGSDAWRERVESELAAGRTDVSTKSGLEEIFEEISPIEDFSETMSLSFRDHRFEPAKYSVEDCKDRDVTYAAP